MIKTSLLRGLSGRLLMLGVLPAVAAITTIVAMSATRGFKSSLRLNEQLLASDVTGACAELSVRNDRWNAIAHALADSQQAGLFGKRRETSEFVRLVNQISANNLSAFVVYEPNADGQDAASLQSPDTPREAMDANGRFVPVWYDEFVGGVRTGQTRLKPSVGMESLEYYLLPKNEFAKTGRTAASITEPYINDGQSLIAHAAPIAIDGKFVGVAGVNRSLDFVGTLANAIRDRSHADVFILSSGGEFIAATADTGAIAGESLKGRSIDATPYAALSARWRGGGTGAATFEADDPLLGEGCVYACGRTEVGGWTVVARRRLSDVTREARSVALQSIGLGALLMVAAAGSMLMVSRGVTLRVRRAAAEADKIARGDLTTQVEESKATDETGSLMRSMRVMSGNLNELVGNVKQAGIRLNSTATEIAATSRQQEASTATFGAASNQIAAAVKEISATTNDLVRTMESVNRMAEETAQLASAGRTGLQGMEGVMHDLSTGTRSIADKLGAISERSQKITTIISTIAKVADQTNILSINAAIEAEKAGEVGSGFLVIAREIRRLADQTASATMDIEEMVQQMQSAVSSGVMEMDRFADQVRRGVRDVGTAGSQLAEIINRVNSSTESFKQVNESMQAQSEGAQQISEAMSSLVANATQTTQSAQEFGRAASDLQSAIATLRDAVARFRLRE